MAQASDGVTDANQNMARSAQVATVVSEGVHHVDDSTQQILAGSASVSQQATALSQLAEEIKTAVHKFTV